ncbi:DDB1- and CUL4-associated factor 10 homolog [Halyomorpha halys]|uniref:DDB1- and CUL4-associated factor 10 homolog n=1 Tax=Halyomorpha halys TaxID=286706 RepID=UPI0006D4E8BC|nr:DDB1- and CUL4-associated factor 10 [Halyomorpha halys]
MKIKKVSLSRNPCLLMKMPHHALETKHFATKFIRDREVGLRPRIGSNDQFMRGLYNAFAPCTSWDHNESLQNAAPGGIFNLEFSPDGSLLVAACEKRSILMFDPLSRQLLSTVDNAHLDCVNCVRFLDSRVFATCSDDSTVALWDARNLKSRIRTLHGHSNWVKNIEFSQSDGLLVTSGFDGAIYTWDINSYTESGFLYNRVFHTNGLMRTRLNPDASKMIICTTGGYLILIHNLDLRTLAKDLDGFKPNMYRLMQLSQTTIPVAANFTHLFSKKRKKNRIEFLTDFPEGDDAEVVSSLQVHPQGWCALSRNISNDENSEWTCVHDIQDTELPTNDSRDPSPELSPAEESETEIEQPDTTEMASLVIGLNSRSPRILSHSEGPRLPRRVLRRQNAFRGFRAQVPPDSSPRGELTVTSTDVWEALIAIREARARRERSNESRNNDEQGGESRLRIVRMQSGIDEGVRPREPSFIAPLGLLHQRPERNNEIRPYGEEGGSRQNRSYYIISRPSRGGFKMKVPKNHTIHQNVPRLTHYIEETNVGKGFIKELCFSADGRLICSPYGYGVRLLAFSPECSELSSCVPKSGPVKLFELGTNVCHTDIVVSTKFSPRHCLLVSGCLTGRIVWHQPVL